METRNENGCRIVKLEGHQVLDLEGPGRADRCVSETVGLKSEEVLSIIIERFEFTTL